MSNINIPPPAVPTAVSGAVLGATGAGVPAWSAALAAGELVRGGGAGAVPSTSGAATVTGAAGSSALTINGGTQTSSVPVLSTAQEWNNAAVTFIAKTNNVTKTASTGAAYSTLERWQLGGVTKFAVLEDGSIVGSGTASISLQSGFFKFFDNSGINRFGCSSTELVLGSTTRLGFGSSADAFAGTFDAFWSRISAGVISQGGAAAASPVAQTLQAQGGSGTDIAGASLTIQPGAGTGAGAASALVIKAPTVGSTGTTAQTQNEIVRFSSAGTKLTNGVIYPAADSTTAVQINKANGTTNVLNVDTTNGRVGIGTVPGNSLHIVKDSTNIYDVLSLVENTLNPFDGATRSVVKNSQSTLILSAYGSASPGVLAGAAGVVCTVGSGFIIGGGPSIPAYVCSYDKFASPEISLINGSITFSGSIKIAATYGGSVVNLTTPAANTLQLGAAAAASPVAQTLQAQGSRAGTDTNVGGANLTLTSGNGTGTGTVSSLLLQSPVAVGSGTGAQTQTTALMINNGNTVYPKTSGAGIKIDTTSPAFGWRDIIGDPTIRSAGANDPAYSVFRDGIRAFEFSATVMKEVWFTFHVPHDYAPGTDVYFHVHWANAAATPNTGNVVWGFEYTFAKGFNQAAFPATATVTVTQACPATQYQHNVAETAAVTMSGLEVDSIIMVRMYRDAAAGGDTCTDTAFIFTSDIHYQSTGIPTKNKAPGFYT